MAGVAEERRCEAVASGKQLLEKELQWEVRFSGSLALLGNLPFKFLRNRQ